MSDPASLARRIQHVDEDMAIAHWHNVRVYLFLRQLQMRHAEVIGRGGAELVQRYPDGLAILAILAPGLQPADRSVTRRLGQVWSETSRWVRYAAVVVEGDSTWAKTMRTVTRGVALLGQSAALRLHGSEDEAISAVLPYAQLPEGSAAQRAELQRVVRELRQRAGLQPTPAGAAAP